MSNLLNAASLVLTPNSYKEGKLYSVIPNTGAGDMSVTRATTATRVNSAGLVELVPYNLLRYSEQFDNGVWVKDLSSITYNQPDPFGGNNAALCTFTNSSLSRVAQMSPIVEGNTYTLSAWIKGVNITDFRFFLGTNQQVTVTSQIVNGEWIRVSATVTATITGTFQQAIARTSTTNGESFYIYGAQLVEGSTALPYQKTETRLNRPRLDYSLGGCPNILLEPQRTNLVLQSEQFDLTTPWNTNISGTGIAPIRTANSVISPSGVQNADTILFNRGVGNTINDQCVINQQITIATTGTYYFTCWMKATTSGDVGKQVFIRCGNAAALQAVTLTANWVRYETTSSVTAGSNGFQVGSRGTITTSNSVSVDLWGAQLEAGSYATSYIPTVSTSVTRNADQVFKTGISSLIGQTEGTLFVEAEFTSAYDSNNLLMTLSDDTVNNLVYINRSNGNAEIVVKVSGVFQVTYNSSILSAGVHKVALGYKANDFVVYIDGVLAHTDTSGSVPACSKLNVGSYWNNSLPYNNGINATALWQTRLTNDELATLTTL